MCAVCSTLCKRPLGILNRKRDPCTQRTYNPRETTKVNNKVNIIKAITAVK